MKNKLLKRRHRSRTLTHVSLFNHCFTLSDTFKCSTLGKRLRNGEEWAWAFPSTMMPSRADTETETETSQSVHKVKSGPLEPQISIRFTTFSCSSNCKILISRSAVMGNWKHKIHPCLINSFIRNLLSAINELSLKTRHVSEKNHYVEYSAT